MKKHRIFVMMCFLPISIFAAEESVEDMKSINEVSSKAVISQEDLNSTPIIESESVEDMELEIINGIVQRKVINDEEKSEETVDEDVDDADNIEPASEVEI